MKIAHINYLPWAVEGSTHYAKISDKAKAARKSGLDFDFFILNDHFDKEEDNLKSIKLKTSAGNIWIKLKNRFLGNYIKDIFRNIESNISLHKYDKIILRYPAPVALDFYCGKFFKSYGNKIITEHHTNEIPEIRGFLPDNIFTGIKLRLEKISASTILSNSSGIIAVTDEIRKVELEKTHLPKPSVTIPNGVDVEGTAFTKFKPFDGRVLNMIFIASVFFPWHALDRLLDGLDKYRGDVKINLLLVGGVYSEYVSRIRSMSRPNVNIRALVDKYGAELDECFRGCTVAVSTLGLFRNAMIQGSPLKTREYIARGIPFIYACDDADLDENCDFALKFENNSSSIDIEKVVEFARKITSLKELPQKMREYAASHLDWKIKIKKMYEFVKNPKTVKD